MKIVRTQDAFYAIENRSNIKQSFVEVADLLDLLYDDKPMFIADIGCAIGAFPWYLKGRFPDSNVVGFEYSEELLHKGRETFPDLNLKFADILDGKFADSNAGKFDVVTLLCVLSIFDDIELPLKNIKKLLKTGGYLLVHGMFNPWPLDVYIKYKSANLPHSDFESGWNIVSQEKMKSVSEDLGFSNIKFTLFKIKVEIEKNFDDPVRSWTETLIEGDRQIVNGLCIKQPQYIFQATC